VDAILGACGVLTQVSQKCITEILATLGAGDQDALKSLIPLVYDELRRLGSEDRFVRDDVLLYSGLSVPEKPSPWRLPLLMVAMK
jgi:hypothetical protein